MVSDPRDEISRLITGVSDHLQEKCNSARLHDNINISYLMVNAKHVEEARAKRKSRDTKRERSFDGGRSMNRVEILYKPRFKKQVLIKFLTSSQNLMIIR